jgi:hypothetical protein
MYRSSSPNSIWDHTISGRYRAASAPPALQPMLRTTLENDWVLVDAHQATEPAQQQSPLTTEEEPLYRPISELVKGSTRDYPSERILQRPIGTRRPQRSRISGSGAQSAAATQQSVAISPPQPPLHSTTRVLDANTVPAQQPLCTNDLSNGAPSRLLCVSSDEIHVCEHEDPQNGLHGEASPAALAVATPTPRHTADGIQLLHNTNTEVDLGSGWVSLGREIDAYGDRTSLDLASWWESF